ncbi:MAG TPA: sialidase family protein [Thermoplasmata archaeon]|nr:sialidase family protein [Thermoplasmata archaeon]
MRRLSPDGPPGLAVHLTIAVVLVLGGLTVAVVNAGSPATRVATLATSGSFFALAESGDTLYAASENSGSVLLERSTDRGVDWRANPVPYSIVASGAPWTHAAVAVDGSNLVLAASSGGAAFGGGLLQPPATPFLASCAQNSTVLLASSPDGGATWSTSTFVTANLSVTSLQAGIVGSSAAIAWLGASTSCGERVGTVEAVTSGDAGRTWTAAQPILAAGDSIPLPEGLEIAPGDQGLVLAFGLESIANGSSQLWLWTLPTGGPPGFTLTTILPAPTSWTLQGSSDSLAYILTPTYLIPLTTPPYTALPFNQLQADGNAVGALPNVVSLVPLGGGTVEVAATTPGSLGVDCWSYDTTRLGVSHSCHVQLGSPWTPPSATLPIVALIDGGGWWVAIGASGDQCGYNCPVGGYPNGGYPVGGNFTPPPSAGPAAVGTSVCITGCSSAQGLAAYSYSPSASAAHGWIGGFSGLMLGVGVLWMAGWALARRRLRPHEPRGLPTEPKGFPPADSDEEERARIQVAYRRGLGLWLIVWSPLALLSILPSPGVDPSLFGWASVGGVFLGVVLTIPFLGAARSRLLRRHGVSLDRSYGESPPDGGGSDVGPAQRAAWWAFGSWVAGGFLLLVLFGDLVSGTPPTYGTASEAGSIPPPLPPEWILLGVATVVFAVLRVLYHLAMASAVGRPPPSGWTGSPETLAVRASVRRTQIGAILLPWNPFVGLLLGFELPAVFPVSPYLIALAFLPVTVLGIALLGGGFGPTVWTSPMRWMAPEDPPGPSRPVGT